MQRLAVFCLRGFHLSRRQISGQLILFLLCLTIFITLLSVLGQIEEVITQALSLFYHTPSSISSDQVSLISVPRILISPPNICVSPLLLLILVPSSPSHLKQRDAIRETWGRSSPSDGFRRLFLLGIPQTQEQRIIVDQEVALHGDIILADFLDSYRNLTLKTLAGLAWASQRCSSAKYILKVDDDVFVNTVLLMQFLQGQKELLYMGRVQWRVRTDRNPSSRHYMPEDAYEYSHYPPYCGGPAYVLAQEAIRLLLQQEWNSPLPPVEDAFIGILAWAAGVPPLHIAKMSGSMFFPHEHCCYRTIFTSHGLSPRGMREAWNLLADSRNSWCPLAMLQCMLFGQYVENGEKLI
ncbi:beta-1,3-galactosyltransferase 4 [Bombina bombina]|uniref:beta-1,3-galactosyltransferase 4 n=1 Tax=Bombina bombina TaxID=8345 RepID=UPI00235AAB96|nr:beta-1,3-galactosyltransferase 4 [Bombina bombina]XP_053577862.1 beta-1,3-galactosyltransferase 4 [Bombina bombina]